MSKETKRSITVELIGHTFQVRTAEPESEVKEDARLVQSVLEEIRRRTGPMDLLRLYALGLLHLGRELRMRESLYLHLRDALESRVASYIERYHRLFPSSADKR
jgi:cell division protein ZapA (FtsZ GTPase activity inhibitor)